MLRKSVFFFPGANHSSSVIDIMEKASVHHSICPKHTEVRFVVCLFCSFFVCCRKTERIQSFYGNYGMLYLAKAQHEHISPSLDMCANVTSRGPMKGRDDKGHLSVVSLEALLLMMGASLARPCQYNSYVSYL